MRRAVALALPALAVACAGCPGEPAREAGRGRQSSKTEEAIARELPAEPGDYWLGRFGGYMSEEERRAFEATPAGERYERFGPRLVEYQRRDALLDPYRRRLDAAALAEYRSLPDYGACRRFLAERFP